jgi:hypothetical protein
MFTGRDALFSVEQAISRVRSDESRLDAALRSAVALEVAAVTWLEPGIAL